MSESTLTPELRRSLADVMESRANVYRLLSRCYRSEMDAVLAREIAEEFSLETDDDALAASLGAMRASLAGIDESGLEMLAVTFDRVFFGMGPLTARHAFPYESVYTSDRGIMMQEAYTQVARTYREQALAKDASFTEPEDHLAVELAFMATLADRAVAFLGTGDGAADKAAEETVRQSLAFARAHLLNWIDCFCAELETAAAPDGEEGFYAALARFTAAFVAGDAALLEEML
ncbi:TorD/DmsD family molecular chaperone [Adlercreutzia shanghongiae]|uniref:Molecular chaperone TorD family protein n=1 Tax=Adlercreutzia shanghongiae TaxID=3111773 RepID=A0ABU6IXC2_9ACTN|nr:molecular chaperone TorD family protein [Adlercreutzia sp. R22]MEC4294174.1 molecular chaperone TorD family protein [Adlercreutzia sp. R22]